jgi:hypothetical protein
MKFATLSKSMIFGAALVLASTAFASTKGSMELSNAVTINGTTLKPGDYRVEWDGTGPNVEVSFIQGKKILAKVPGQIVQLPQPASNSAALTHDNGSATKSLAGVRFEGKKFALDLGTTSESMQGGSSK